MSDKNAIETVVGHLRYKLDTLWDRSRHLYDEEIESVMHDVQYVFKASEALAAMNRYVDSEDIEDEVFEVTQAVHLYKEMKRQEHDAEESFNLNAALLSSQYIRQAIEAKHELFMAVRRFVKYMEGLTLYVEPPVPTFKPWEPPI